MDLQRTEPRLGLPVFGRLHFADVPAPAVQMFLAEAVFADDFGLHLPIGVGDGDPDLQPAVGLVMEAHGDR